MGGLLFSLAIKLILRSLSSPLTVGFMDDVTLGGSKSTVSTDVGLFRIERAKLGLNLNVSKCEIISRDQQPFEGPNEDFTRINPSDAVLLGAPLGPGSALESALEGRCSYLRIAIDYRKNISAHDVFIFLRSSFSVSTLMYTLRCSPCTGHHFLEIDYGLLREGIPNSFLSDLQWLQVSPSIRAGGLGIRRTSSLALSAFLASAASRSGFQDRILSACMMGIDEKVRSARCSWSSSNGLPWPSNECAVHQCSWDAPGVAREWNTIWKGSLGELDQARLIALKAPHNSDWLFALPPSNLPITSCDLRLSDEAIRVAVVLRLGLNICEPHTCPCGADFCVRGTHGLSCKKGNGRSTRHHQVNDLV